MSHDQVERSMGLDFAVACFDCKLFSDLHKWPIVEEMRDRFHTQQYDRDIFPGKPSYSVVRVSADELSRGLRQAQTDSECNVEYIQASLPSLHSFVKQHWTHR